MDFLESVMTVEGAAMSEVRIVVLGAHGSGQTLFSLRTLDRELAASIGFELLRAGPNWGVHLQEDGESDEYLNRPMPCRSASLVRDPTVPDPFIAFNRSRIFRLIRDMGGNA